MVDNTLKLLSTATRVVCCVCRCASLWLENVIVFFLFPLPSHVLFDPACRSGLEQDDMRILYKYLTTSLFPRHSEPEVRMCEQKSGGIIVKRQNLVGKKRLKSMKLLISYDKLSCVLHTPSFPLMEAELFKRSHIVYNSRYQCF